MLDERYLTTVSGLSGQQRRELTWYYAQLDETRRVYVHWQQRTVFKHLLADGRANAGKGGEANYVALLLALKSLWEDEQRGAIAGTNATERQPRQRRPRKQQLRDSLEKRFMAQLVALREQQQLSWREIAAQFKKQFRKQVSHTYLKKIYDERTPPLT
jgi:hypothetical protein